MQLLGMALCALGVVLVLIGFGLGSLRILNVEIQVTRTLSAWTAIVSGIAFLIVGAMIWQFFGGGINGGGSSGTSGGGSAGNTGEVIASADGSGETTEPKHLAGGVTLTVHAVEGNGESGFYFTVDPPHRIHVDANFQCSEEGCGQRSMMIGTGGNDHFIVHSPNWHAIPFQWSVQVYSP